VPAVARDALMAAAEAAGVALTQIGIIRSGPPGVRFLDHSGKPMLFNKPSFSHF